VNHRFLDLKLRGTALDPALEDAIGARVRAVVERGSVSVSVHLTRSGGPVALRIDSDAAERTHRVLAVLAARLGTPSPDLALVLSQPGVVLGADASPDDAAAFRGAALGALDAALTQLNATRQAEGAALAAELQLRLDELIGYRAQIAVLSASVPRDVARRLTERIKRITEEVAVDPVRLAQEVALLADRADVTEELVRLASHLDQAGALLEAPGAIGRRFDFLVQEIGRELNTIGAKAATAEISTAIVASKTSLEKVREQVQNVE
jgi:uncharacterized protein (TIGR00255 family)